MENIRTNNLLKNTTILVFGQFCTKGIMFFMTPLITRWLSTDEYGQFDLFLTYATLIITIITLSSGEAIFRFLFESEEETYQSRVLSTALIIHLAAIGLAMAAGILIWCFTDTTGLLALSAVTYLVSEIIYRYMTMAMRGEKRLNIYTLGNILFVVGMAVGVLVFAKGLHLGLSGILLGYAVGNAIASVAIGIISGVYRKFTFRKLDRGLFKRMIAYSLPLIPNTISWWIVNASDRTLISIFLGTGFNAVYAIANKIPSLCTNFFGAFHLSWQQTALETISDEDRDRYYSSVLNNMIAIIGSVCILLLCGSYWFFKLLFSEKYFPGFYQTPILLLAMVFSMVGRSLGSIYAALMQSMKNGMTFLLSAVLNVAINFLLIQHLQLYAASISTLVSYVVLFAVRFLDIRRDINIHLDRKSCLVIYILLYFVITSYIPYMGLRYLNLVAGVLCFVLLNRNLAGKLLKKIIPRKNHEGLRSQR